MQEELQTSINVNIFKWNKILIKDRKAMNKLKITEGEMLLSLIYHKIFEKKGKP